MKIPSLAETTTYHKTIIIANENEMPASFATSKLDFHQLYSLPTFHSLSTMPSLHKFIRKFAERVNVLYKEKKRKKPKSPNISDLTWLTSSFAAMEVSSQLKHVFKFFDSDGDGKISTLELSEVLWSLGHDKSMAAKEAEGMVREMDCDGDGYVDLNEFMNVMDTDNKALMDAFLVFDTDKNGFISAKELQRVLSSLGCDKCSLSQCQKMINGVDKDGDGFVDFEEFKLMMGSGL